MNRAYDAIVIGTGQAGPSLAAALAGAGRQVAVIERRSFGGTCVNTGCVPTKSLVASARAAHVTRRAAEFGVRITGPVTVDMVEQWLRKTPNLAVYEGHARFAAPHTIDVDGTLLDANQIFINVGGRSIRPLLAGLETVDHLDNSTMMEIDVLPEHLVIVGGSYIGLEFAQMYRRFGSQVTVIERAARLIPREDEDVSDAVREILEVEGVTVRLNAECISLARRGNGVDVGVTCADGSPAVTGSHLLLAVGRRPNTDDLGVEKAALELDARGYLVVDDQLQTSVEGVWALGDCNGRGAFTHTAYNDYEIVADNLLKGETRRVTDRITTYGLFVDPPLGRAA